MKESLHENTNSVIPARNVGVALEPVPEREVISGSPEQGTRELGELGNCEFGIWELRQGTVVDTEVDEVFVVLSGAASIDLLDENRTVEVTAGDVMRLVAGTRTRWHVKDHIRKVYVAPASA